MTNGVHNARVSDLTLDEKKEAADKLREAAKLAIEVSNS